MWGLDVRLDTAGGYRWQLWSADGRKSAMSPHGFRARFNAHRAADLFRDMARELEYRTESVGPGQYRWQAVDADGDVVAVSALTYATIEDADEAAELVRKRAVMALL
jgi:uncharacterized protein YegP (UPF0339 family)